MDTRWIVLWLESPLQAWGYDSKFGRRETLDFPTKSGILGLVLCALGATGEQKELLLRFADLHQTVLSFKKKSQSQGKLPSLHDFQMIGAGYDDKDSWETNHIPKKEDGTNAVGGGTKITHRYYLQDAVFAVLLEVPADLSAQIEEALKNPAYDLYLGRKCCVPSEFIYQGTCASENEAERFAQAKAGEYKSSSLCDEFHVVDGEKYKEGDVFTLNDVPVQFGMQKKYRDRRVTKIYSERKV